MKWQWWLLLGLLVVAGVFFFYPRQAQLQTALAPFQSSLPWSMGSVGQVTAIAEEGKAVVLTIERIPRKHASFSIYEDSTAFLHLLLQQLHTTKGRLLLRKMMEQKFDFVGRYAPSGAIPARELRWSAASVKTSLFDLQSAHSRATLSIERTTPEGRRKEFMTKLYHFERKNVPQKIHRSVTLVEVDTTADALIFRYEVDSVGINFERLRKNRRALKRSFLQVFQKAMKKEDLRIYQQMVEYRFSVVHHYSSTTHEEDFSVTLSPTDLQKGIDYQKTLTTKAQP